MPTPTLVQINTSKRGMPKLPVAGPARVTADGVEGDWQKNRKYHGGPNRAICLFSEELYAALAEKGTPLLANGSVESETVELGPDISDAQLAAASAHLTAHLEGRPLSDVTELTSTGDPAVDELCRKGLEAVRP